MFVDLVHMRIAFVRWQRGECIRRCEVHAHSVPLQVMLSPCTEWRTRLPSSTAGVAVGNCTLVMRASHWRTGMHTGRAHALCQVGAVCRYYQPCCTVPAYLPKGLAVSYGCKDTWR